MVSIGHITTIPHINQNGGTLCIEFLDYINYESVPINSNNYIKYVGESKRSEN